jgi:hypothetical protein
MRVPPESGKVASSEGNIRLFATGLVNETACLSDLGAGLNQPRCCSIIAA